MTSFILNHFPKDPVSETARLELELKYRELAGDTVQPITLTHYSPSQNTVQKEEPHVSQQNCQGFVLSKSHRSASATCFALQRNPPLWIVQYFHMIFESLPPPQQQSGSVRILL